MTLSDTPPHVQALLNEMMRRAPGWRKLEMMAELNASVRLLALSGLRSRHPNDTPEQLRRRLADMLLGPDLARRAYGPMPGE